MLEEVRGLVALEEGEADPAGGDETGGANILRGEREPRDEGANDSPEDVQPDAEPVVHELDELVARVVDVVGVPAVLLEALAVTSERGGGVSCSDVGYVRKYRLRTLTSRMLAPLSPLVVRADGAGAGQGLAEVREDRAAGDVLDPASDEKTNVRTSFERLSTTTLSHLWISVLLFLNHFWHT